MGSRRIANARKVNGKLIVDAPCPNCDLVAHLEGEDQGSDGWYFAETCADCKCYFSLIPPVPS